MANRRLKAILNRTGIVDLQGDIILAGAFDADIKAKRKMPALKMHVRGEIVGEWSKLEMKGADLVAEAVLYTDPADGGYDMARMVVKLIETKQLKGVSIGFRPVKWTNVSTPERRYGWDISELELREASFVDRAANPPSMVTELKQKYDKAKSAEEQPVEAIFKFFDGAVELLPDEDPAPAPEPVAKEDAEIKAEKEAIAGERERLKLDQQRLAAESERLKLDRATLDARTEKLEERIQRFDERVKLHDEREAEFQQEKLELRAKDATASEDLELANRLKAIGG